MENNKFIDLHVHSNISDGMFAPKQLIKMANDNSVGILSITDHDSIGGLYEFQNNICGKMLGVKGIEFSSYVICDNEKYKIHLLGYGFDENNGSFQALVQEMSHKRVTAHMQVLSYLRAKLKKFPEDEMNKLDIMRYCWFDKEVINCLQKLEYSQKVIREISDYYKVNRFSYGNDYNAEARKVIDAIHSASGYAIFAHPMAYKFSDDRDVIQRIIKMLIDMGINGMEIYQSDCSIGDTRWLRQIVDSNHLLYSVGSDFHKNVHSDGRQIGLGINNNLCISETSLTNEIIKCKKYIRKVN